MIQAPSMISVMSDLEEKKKVGWMIPDTVADAFDALCETMANGKEKWVVLSACMIAFMKMIEKQKSDAIAEAHAQKAAGRRFGDIIPKQYRRRPSATLHRNGSIEFER